MTRLAILAVASVLLVSSLWFLKPSYGSIRQVAGPALEKIWHPSQTESSSHHDELRKSTTNDAHPMSQLIRRADSRFASLMLKSTSSVHSSAQAYRERRGRQPPPGFDIWYDFAVKHNAVIVEDLFDQIYHDLAPFWGVPAKQIREQANDFQHRISIRNHNVTHRTDGERPWMKLWTDMVDSVAQHLPDLDMPINVMDESRMVVPWEDIDRYMTQGHRSKRIVPTAELVTEFQSIPYMDQTPAVPFEPAFEEGGLYWERYAVGCAPGTRARQDPTITDFTTPPPLNGSEPDGSYHGYVQNWTNTMSPCNNPDLQSLHGTFVEPLSMSNTRQFFPLFGGSKLPMNNEILLPPAMYWSEDPMYSGGNSHGPAWNNKSNGIIWRGAASGGRNRAENWHHFQRHRFVAMVNATTVRSATDPEHPVPPKNFVLPRPETYNATFANQLGMADWIDTWSDAVFAHLLCFPPTAPDEPFGTCRYTNEYFSRVDFTPMLKQYDYKYLPDLDGNSFSGRYRAFLFSASLPIKATIYKEWHDSRLIPWKHFVPMDNSFIDIYGIMRYFVGDASKYDAGHDDVGEKIAMAGKEWAERTLRREDMQVYVLRLLLEYARLCDDRREVMGWNEDSVPGDWDA